MRNETVQLKKLIADDGMMLTNGEAYGKTVFLAANDSADNWREVAEEECETAEQEKAVENNAEPIDP